MKRSVSLGKGGYMRSITLNEPLADLLPEHMYCKEEW